MTAQFLPAAALRAASFSVASLVVALITLPLAQAAAQIILA